MLNGLRQMYKVCSILARDTQIADFTACYYIDKREWKGVKRCIH